MTILIKCDKCGEEEEVKHTNEVVSKLADGLEDDAHDVCTKCNEGWLSYMKGVQEELQGLRRRRVEEFFEG